MLNALVPIPIYLTLGAITTLGVTWGIALRGVHAECADRSTITARVFPHSPLRALLPHDAAGGIWARVHSSSAAGPACEVNSFHDARVEAILPDRVVLMYFGWSGASTATYGRARATPWLDPAPPAGANQGAEYRFGWPFASMWCATYAWGGGCERLTLPATHLWTIRGSPDTDIALKSDVFWGSGGAEYAVPTGLLSLGFTLNSVIFGGAWWLGLIIPRAARSRWRRGRGRCPGCGYSRAGLDPVAVCPECATKPRLGRSRSSLLLTSEGVVRREGRREDLVFS